jgi:hypothetical protein
MGRPLFENLGHQSINMENFGHIDGTQAMRELPKYECHKEVWALKIAKIVRDGESQDRETNGTATITPADEGYAPFTVDAEFMRRHNPEVDGYYVQYEDGYKSFSPAKAFEDGYKAIN